MEHPQRGRDIKLYVYMGHGRGEPADVANAALFLASKASDFVNGHILYVDDGILANFGYVKGENEV